MGFVRLSHHLYIWKWKSCPTLWDPMDYTAHGIFQTRILGWVAFPFSRGSFQPRDQTQVLSELQEDSFPAYLHLFLSVQFSSVAQSCPTLCNPMNRSTPGLPVHHQLPGFTQTHVHWVGDAIQPSHPLSSPSPPAPNPSQHQGLFQWVNSSHEVAKVSAAPCNQCLLMFRRMVLGRCKLLNPWPRFYVSTKLWKC